MKERTLGKELQGPPRKRSRRIPPQTESGLREHIKEQLVQSIISKDLEIWGDKNVCALEDTEQTKSDKPRKT